mgnify:CR=1 FL=1
MHSGYGSLWERKKNLPSIRPQYQLTPKINPSLSLNYKKDSYNIYFQGDYLYTETLNKNEFVKRVYDDGSVVNQQSKRNRDTHFTTIKTGIDWNYDDNNTLSFSGLFGSEKIIDNGDQPFFNEDFSERLRLWQFVEDELKTTFMATASFQHKFSQPGHLLNAGINYTFHREDERYAFDNILPTFTGKDSFKLLSDEKVIDLNIIGTMLPTQVFSELFAKQKSGNIINISSASAQRPLTRVVGYSASKAAIDNFTQWMAVELAQKYGEGIRVNAISPGFFIGEQNRALLLTPEGKLTPRGEKIIDHTPMGRFGSPEDIDGALLFLCSDMSKFVTGTILKVDGGFAATSI